MAMEMAMAIIINKSVLLNKFELNYSFISLNGREWRREDRRVPGLNCSNDYYLIAIQLSMNPTTTTTTTAKYGLWGSNRALSTNCGKETEFICLIKLLQQL